MRVGSLLCFDPASHLRSLRTYRPLYLGWNATIARIPHQGIIAQPARKESEESQHRRSPQIVVVLGTLHARGVERFAYDTRHRSQQARQSLVTTTRFSGATQQPQSTDCHCHFTRLLLPAPSTIWSAHSHVTAKSLSLGRTAPLRQLETARSTPLKDSSTESSIPFRPLSIPHIDISSRRSSVDESRRLLPLFGAGVEVAVYNTSFRDLQLSLLACII